MTEPPLFVAEGQPSELDVLLMAEELGPGADKGGHADLTMPFRSPSHISIGDPIAQALGDGYAARQQAPDQEFFQVQLACSFQAAPGCRFEDARFAVALTTESAGDGAAAGTAIAYDLFPLLLEDARTVKTTTSIKPELSFAFEPVSGTVTLPSREKVEESIRYTSRVVAFDLQGSRPAWSFQRTGQHEISGPQRLFMIVRKPRGTRVRAAFSLTAHVRFVLYGRGFAPVELTMLFRDRDRSTVLTDEPSVVLC